MAKSLQKLLVHKLKDSSLKVEYEITLAEMEKIVSRMYEELVAGLNDLPRVENKIFSILVSAPYSSAALTQRKPLAGRE